jgi:hypothetical protein
MSKNLSCEVRATRRADRPTAYFKRRRTDENVVSTADYSVLPHQDHTLTTSEAPIYTGDTALATSLHTYTPLHNNSAGTQEWPKQLNPANHVLENTFWNAMISAPMTSAELNFGSAPLLLAEPSQYNTQAYQGFDLEPATQVASTGSDNSMSGSPALHDTEFSGPQPYTEGSASSTSDVQSCAGNNASESTNDEILEDWPMFKCIPTSYNAINPELGREYLEGLLHASKGSNVSSSQSSPSSNVTENAGKTRAALFDSDTRDKLMGLTQCFLMKGWETHAKGGSRVPITVTLPALTDLHTYFNSFIHHHEPFYSVFPQSNYDAARMIDDREENISCLMILLMIAQGALSAHPTSKARLLSLGITEACRIGMLDLLEKNVSMSIQPDMLRCILVYITLASWSGTRWHMDVRQAPSNIYHARVADNFKVALSQHTMYLAVRTALNVLPTVEVVTDIGYPDAKAFEHSQSPRAGSARRQWSS